MKIGYLSCVMLAVLAGCGGSGSSDQFDQSFDEVQASQGTLLGDAIDSFNEEGFTDLSGLPTTGSASFEGVIGLGDFGASISAPAVLGQMDADINLRTNAVSGTAGNFYATFNEQPISGTLDFDAEFDRDVDTALDFSIVGTLDGRLSGDAGSLDVDLETRAFLTGDDSDIMLGTGFGTLDDIPLEATFILENTQ